MRRSDRPAVRSAHSLGSERRRTFSSESSHEADPLGSIFSQSHTLLRPFRKKIDVPTAAITFPAMPATLQSLKSDALHLAPEERLQLAGVLLASVEPVASDASESAWDAEIRRRIAEFDAGQLVTIQGKNVFEALDRKLAR